jgi:hypothetical protein
VQTKACIVCGAVFPRNASYSRAQWERARFCSNACRGTTLKKPRAICACGCGQLVSRTTSRYRPGHNPPAVAGTITLWQPSGRKPRFVFRDRQGRLVYFARAVIEAHLRRHLRPTEVVHHKNGDSTDDRFENLRLYSNHAAHMRDEYAAGRLTAMH